MAATSKFVMSNHRQPKLRVTVRVSGDVVDLVDSIRLCNYSLYGNKHRVRKIVINSCKRNRSSF